MSLDSIIADARQELKDTLLYLPDGVAETSDYEIWGKQFAEKLVRNRKAIAHHPTPKQIPRRRTKDWRPWLGYQTTTI